MERMLRDISQSPKVPYLAQYLHPQQKSPFRQVVDVCRNLLKRRGAHSIIAMSSGGFHYTDDGDTALCDTCGLQVSGWTLDMKPFTVHAQRSPKCPYVCSILPTEHPIVPSTITATSVFSTLNDGERPFKRQKIETANENCRSSVLVEVETLKQIRRRTFSHWPHRTSPSSTQMIEAGFFNCNVGDRVICLYCNLICQQWVPNTDDPWEVHKTLSPKCPYVITMLKRQQPSALANANISQENQVALHKTYAEPKTRYASFVTWSNENLPSVDDLVRAGFFYTGSKTIVTCFHCNGSLHNWGANDNPIVEHARRFPHCAYAKQLCGDKLYRKLQEQKRHREEDNNYHEFNTRLKINSFNSSSESVQPFGNNELSRHIDARLDLPISRNLLVQNFSLPIIRRCWEDQLLSKHVDFISDSELLMACRILQKQIELGVEEGNNIIIPSKHMTKSREREQTGLIPLNQINNILPSNPCILCSKEEKRLVCIPCRHLATCISCGHGLQSCPICRKEICSFVHI